MDERVADSARPVPRAVHLASTVSMVWGVVMFLSGVAILFPMTIGGITFSIQASFTVFLMMALSLLFVYLGWKIRHGSRADAGRLIAVNLLSALLTLTFRFRAAPIGAFLGLIVVAILMVHWDALS
ncbi:MAG: hypothetical protein JO102_04160 [Elusimicrobia bacterium]|nr:hypothetical protein [Elusimicrobiota bacterium]